MIALVYATLGIAALTVAGIAVRKKCDSFVRKLF
jgi:hypothetical protein